MTLEEAKFYDQILGSLPTGRRIFSGEISIGQSHTHIKAALRDMEKDGFIKVHTETANSDAGSNLMVLREDSGEVFLAKGGYIQKAKDRLSQERVQKGNEAWKIRLEWIKTLATVAAVLVAFFAWIDSKKINMDTNEKLDEFDAQLLRYKAVHLEESNDHQNKNIYPIKVSVDSSNDNAPK